MKIKSATQFANWLAQVHPNIFVTLVKRAIPAANNPKLGDLTDVLSSIGTDLSGAVSGVGSFLSNSANVQALSTAASAYFNSQSSGNVQNAVLQTQLQRAQAGLPPAAINYATNASGQLTPVYLGTQPINGLGSPLTLPNGNPAYSMTPTALSALAPGFLQKYGLWLAIGGAGLVLVLILRR